ncbi:hypothetical protein FIV41_08995 [Pseudomonas marginalis]|uniref:Uncharacterized protein n=1 Tax=Pseudomonas marginalis TaxID=298 RepID=A0A9X9BV32_PSEMA|nr:hypothetical protein [Pseudomonas marginalis]TWR61186.1 hypothetical protein FIV41_08995 [Pseudomonas marginalis]SEB36484.1 hypothetical protein SAMN04490193_0688 [Pseudomonas marginalis]
MGHSANFQVELYARKLEQAAEGLTREGTVLKDNGLDSLGEAVLSQAKKLKLAVAELRGLMST